MDIQRRLEAVWYGAHPLGALLAPLSWLFCAGVALRRFAYRSGLAASRRFPVPVIVVGNIAVGGTGKTPLVIWLCRFLEQHGYRPGIVCRGWGGSARHWPQQVRADGDAVIVGDESVVLARRCGRPVAAGPDRGAAIAQLLSHTDCDLVISDDGLQQYALARDVEIAVIDGARRHGNGRCLPAGPLREPPSRLRSVDLVVHNGGRHERGEFGMELVAGAPRRVRDEHVADTLEELGGTRVHAVCGIGHPARFFSLLRHLGLELIVHPFPDHHAFRREDVDFADSLPVLMTEKDAVKCRRFADQRHWYLPVDAHLHPALGDRVLALLEEREDGQEAAGDTRVSAVQGTAGLPPQGR